MMGSFLENDELIIFCSIIILVFFLFTALLITWISRDKNDTSVDISDSDQ